MKTKRASVHVWHLEMTERPEATAPTADYELRQTTRPLPELNRFLYATVGAPWDWYMRLKWTWQEWQAYLDREEVQTWIAFQGATPIGYFELEQQSHGSAEIVYFGLLPEFIGSGLGGQLLTDAIEKAWLLATERIWVHTCTLDHPAALPNYLARGFTIFREEDLVDDVPDERLQPWEGAAKPA